MANVNLNNPNPTQHLQAFIKFQPDILLLIEAGSDWQTPNTTTTGIADGIADGIATGIATDNASKSTSTINANNNTNHTTNYPYGCGHDENSPFALKVLSKQPIHCDIKLIEDLPYARIELAGQVIYAVHPPPPIGNLAITRNLYLKRLAKHIQTETQPTLVTGDFNLTPFSPIYRDFIKQTGLKPRWCRHKLLRVINWLKIKSFNTVSFSCSKVRKFFKKKPNFQ